MGDGFMASFASVTGAVECAIALQRAFEELHHGPGAGRGKEAVDVRVGSIAFDTIRTPFGEAKDIVGGSLTYFAVAASYFTDVNLVAVVGEDFKKKHMQVFAERRIDLQGVEHADGKTFRWGAEYGYNLDGRKTLFTELNVFEGFEPKLPEPYKQADIVFLGNIHPSLQLSVLQQVTSKRLAGLDSMNLWIDSTPGELREALKRVDILKIDDSEARQLSD